MGAAKDILLRPISRTDADALVMRVHYSGKVVNNSQLHIGVFYQGKLEGAMQFGPSLDKRKIQPLVSGTPWNGFLELNRMAFSEALPRNSESRALGIAMRLLRRYAPHVQWVVSFADAAQCGDGTIYRAAGFVLTGIRRNTSVWARIGEANATVFSRVSLTDPSSAGQKRAALRGGGAIDAPAATKGRAITDIAARRGFTERGYISNGANGGSTMRPFIEAGYTPIPGFQLRYLYFLDPSARERLTVPILPYSEIARRGARMYRGQACAASIADDAPGLQPGEDGAAPIAALHNTDA